MTTEVEGDELKIVSVVSDPFPKETTGDTHNSHGVVWNSLCRPQGKPIDLQFILTSGKSMLKDMKASVFYDWSGATVPEPGNMVMQACL